MKQCMLTCQTLKPSWALSALACRCNPSHLTFATLCYDVLGASIQSLLPVMLPRLCHAVL